MVMDLSRHEPLATTAVGRALDNAEQRTRHVCGGVATVLDITATPDTEWVTV
jgi:hypothetical protein